VSHLPSGRRVPAPPAPAVRAPVVRAAALAYAALLALVTLLPIRWGPGLAHYPGNWRPQLVPVWNLVANLGHGDRAPAVLAGVAGNVALFVPLGFLLPLLAPWFDRHRRAVAAGLALSLAIELSQLAFPGVRRADVNDVLLNALGAALGFAAHRLAAGPRA
jgi:glycopeptide antibiotics resistance protein